MNLADGEERRGVNSETRGRCSTCLRGLVFLCLLCSVHGPAASATRPATTTAATAAATTQVTLHLG